MAAGNGIAAVAASQGLAVYDVANPSAPLRLAVIPGNVVAVALRGNLLLAAFSDTVRLYDIATPTAPRLVWERVLQAAQVVALDASAAFRPLQFAEQCHRVLRRTGGLSGHRRHPHSARSGTRRNARFRG